MPHLPILNQNSKSVDVGRKRVGQVYAQALIRAFPSPAVAETVLTQLGCFVRDVYLRIPGLREFFGSPRISPAEKEKLLTRVFEGRVHDGLVRFLKVAGWHGRLDCLEEIYSAGRVLWNQANGIREVEVTTATPLDLPMRASIEKALQTALGSAVELHERVRPELIGGIRFRIGDQVLDASIANRLVRLSASTVEEVVREIRTAGDRFTTLTT